MLTLLAQSIQQISNPTMADVDAAAGGHAPTLEGDRGNNVPMKKRKMTEEQSDDVPQTTDFGTSYDAKHTKAYDAPPSTFEAAASADQDGGGGASAGPQPIKRAPMPKAREIRLEQNRKAARESRRRKKVMIEELQRSVIFFSRANGTLKQQNDELSRHLMQAKSQVASIESGQHQAQVNSQEAAAKAQSEAASQQHHYASASNVSQQVQANTVATQAMYESQGFPPGAARSAAQTMNASAPPVQAHPGNQVTYNHPAPAPANPQVLPPMQPGATMQAMANFQQAATAAMQAAMGMNQTVATHIQQPQAAQAQQAYMDTMNAFMQQQAAAAAAAGHQYVMGMNPQMQGIPMQMMPQAMMAGPPMTWAPAQQQQQQPQQSHQHQS